MLPCLWHLFIFVEERMFSYNASCNLWNLAPWGRMQAWNFHTYTCTEPGKLDCRELLQGVGGMGCMHFPTHRLSLWKSGGNLTHIRKNLVFWISPPIPHFGSGVGSPRSRTENVPFLLLSANIGLCALHHTFSLRTEDIYSPLPYLFKFHPQNIFHFKSSKELLDM